MSVVYIEDRPVSSRSSDEERDVCIQLFRHRWPGAESHTARVFPKDKMRTTSKINILHTWLSENPDAGEDNGNVGCKAFDVPVLTTHTDSGPPRSTTLHPPSAPKTCWNVLLQLHFFCFPSPDIRPPNFEQPFISKAPLFLLPCSVVSNC